ncbi:MAG: histidine kinase dimerization/phosphoacceptor domain -containing protein [Spirochaetia bacterium]|nr:histidine kinase dimerization/phosphoacceptor domain -containing protein [Spirochaetia bacterium]
MKDKNGSPEQILFSTRDITKRKQAEEALKNSRNLLDATQRIAQVGGWEWDVERQTMTWADQTYLIHGFEPGEFAAGSPEHIQRSLACYDPDDRPKIDEAFRKCVEEGEAYTLELPLTTSQGRRIWVQTSAQAVLDKGRVVKVQGHIMDITERRRAEEKLREALKEKDFLMKELNHRVKNNLFMVSSLISLKNSETEIDLSDIQHQIEAIGLIHEKLYQTENVTEICCRDYFDDLLNSIFSTFTTQQVRTVENVEDLCVSTKTAMTLGLIINEIATNAIKHGFTDKEEAVFSVKMKEDTENHRYELTLSNTGNPFPEDIDIESTDTLGLRLINALVAQIEGTIKLQKKPNPFFTIRFPIGEE